jgi:hypothetical protein
MLTPGVEGVFARCESGVPTAASCALFILVACFYDKAVIAALSVGAWMSHAWPDDSSRRQAVAQLWLWASLVVIPFVHSLPLLAGVVLNAAPSGVLYASAVMMAAGALMGIYMEWGPSSAVRRSARYTNEQPSPDEASEENLALYPPKEQPQASNAPTLLGEIDGVGASLRAASQSAIVRRMFTVSQSAMGGGSRMHSSDQNKWVPEKSL